MEAHPGSEHLGVNTSVNPLHHSSILVAHDERDKIRGKPLGPQPGGAGPPQIIGGAGLYFGFFTGEAERELLVWAQWRPFIEGRAFPLEERPPRAGACFGGRHDQVDEQHEELALALLVRQTLQLLRRKNAQGEQHAALLEEVFVKRCATSRKQALSSLGSSPQPGAEAQELAGLLASPPTAGARYRRMGGLARESLRRYGSKKLKEALNAYCTARNSLKRCQKPDLP